MINVKSLLITIVVAFVAIQSMDFLVHGVWLKPVYEATASLWRSEAEMQSMMPVMLLGHFLTAGAFTLIYAAAVAEKRRISCTLKYASTMGLFAGAGQLMMYAVQPYPGSLVVKWIVAGIIESIILGVIVFKVYKLPAKQS